MKRIDPDAEALGERIVAARRAKGWSQAQLARESDSQPVTVFRHEKGHVRPNLDSVVMYAKLLGVSVEWIMNGGSGGPPVTHAAQDEQPPTGKVVRQSRSGESTDVPMVVATFLSGTTYRATIDEIAYLARFVRHEPYATPDDLELALLSRRAMQTRGAAELEAFNAAIHRQAKEREGREIDLSSESQPTPDRLAKARPKHRPKR